MNFSSRYEAADRLGYMIEKVFKILETPVNYNTLFDILRYIVCIESGRRIRCAASKILSEPQSLV